MDVAVATRTGFEPVISALTGQYVSRYTTGPGAAGRHSVTPTISLWPGNGCVKKAN